MKLSRTGTLMLRQSSGAGWFYHFIDPDGTCGHEYGPYESIRAATVAAIHVPDPARDRGPAPSDATYFPAATRRG
jgi:hypothetical protein